MTDNFESLNSGEVISLSDPNYIFKVGELDEVIKEQLKNSLGSGSQEKQNWFTSQGIECEVLRFGSSGWQKGKIRMSLQFCPDETVDKHQASTQNHLSSEIEEENKKKIVESITTTIQPENIPEQPQYDPSMAQSSLDLTLETIEDIHLDFSQDDLAMTSMSIDSPMDLDLTDLAADGEYLDFESGNFPEASGDLTIPATTNQETLSLMDEVWSEMSQPNWPGTKGY